MKKIISLILIIVVCSSFYACEQISTGNNNYSDDVSDQQNDNSNTATIPAVEDNTVTEIPPSPSKDKIHEGVCVHRTSLGDYNVKVEEYVSKFDADQKSKLANYPSDIVSVFSKHGFSEAYEIGLERVKYIEDGNYSRYEMICVTYHDPECKESKHALGCMVSCYVYICEPYDPVTTKNYKLSYTSGQIDIYEFTGELVDSLKGFKIVMGEYALCNVHIPNNNIVGEEDTKEILNDLVDVAASIRQDLLETSPEIINGK